jgi:hypothetical protein
MSKKNVLRSIKNIINRVFNIYTHYLASTFLSYASNHKIIDERELSSPFSDLNPTSAHGTTRDTFNRK